MAVGSMTDAAIAYAEKLREFREVQARDRVLEDRVAALEIRIAELETLVAELAEARSFVTHTTGGVWPPPWSKP
jgi:uncharacterized protein YceH (UPF0502 family)